MPDALGRGGIGRGPSVTDGFSAKLDTAAGAVGEGAGSNGPQQRPARCISQLLRPGSAGCDSGTAAVLRSRGQQPTGTVIASWRPQAQPIAQSLLDPSAVTSWFA